MYLLFLLKKTFLIIYERSRLVYVLFSYLDSVPILRDKISFERIPVYPVCSLSKNTSRYSSDENRNSMNIFSILREASLPFIKEMEHNMSIRYAVHTLGLLIVQRFVKNLKSNIQLWYLNSNLMKQLIKQNEGR